jgi:H+/Cl- antiporter ClcA
VEELVKTHISLFKTAIFTAVIIAGITAQGILGSYLYLGYPDVTKLSTFIFIFVALVALLAGLGGSIMCRIILKLLIWKKSLKGKRFEVLYVLSCAIIIAVIAYFGYYSILGSGKADMTQLLFTGHKYGGWQLPILRMIGPIISFTTGAAGGIFAPALSAGAAIGSLVAEWFSLVAANANILILAGMVAFLTGVTRSPFTSAILVLEMTDRHSATFLLLLAAMIASLISTLVDKKSLYEHLKEQYTEDVLNTDTAEHLHQI